MAGVTRSRTRIAIVGGGPAGYEAALVAVQLEAEVTLVERDGVGGQCVLTDCVPSKTFIATSEFLVHLDDAEQVGVSSEGAVSARVADVHARVKALALAQSADIAARLGREGVRVLTGHACLEGPGRVSVALDDGGEEQVDADVVLLATGAHPRVLPGAEPDGERILDWRQLYDLPELPPHLVVIGSGVTGAEFANAYLAMGSRVTLVSSRERVLPGEDRDAAELLQEVFTRRGMEVRRGRAAGVERTRDGVVVRLNDGRAVEASHALMTVGSVPNTRGLGLDEAGVALDDGGFVRVDRVSRTTVPGVYAAGDCTGVLMLASVAAMQGRIAMWHALGEAVAPLRLATVSANVFTDPQVASVGVTQTQVESGQVSAHVVRLPLATNARAKMLGITDGFVKLFCRPGPGTVLGGVVVGPNASELVLPVSLAVQHGLTVDQVAHTFSIYPSLSGSLTEAARQLMLHG
jgi:pyruvate/2-oxoglutarate dehydrogenase complex dihydrolipoamide dehydrogenase (E3) component